MKKIAIIGGGPGGLMAAEKLAEAGHAVTVFDRKASFGRKFLMAGRGGLNLTHSEPLEAFLDRYGAARPFLEQAIRDFPPEALRAWSADLGQETFVGSSGRVFPKEMKASPLLRAWLQRLEQLGVTACLAHTWQGWDEAGALRFKSPAGEISFKADVTLLALGGASWPKLGTDGSWADILRARGVDVAPFQPANCGFLTVWSDIFQQRFAGQPLKSVTLTHQGRSVSGDVIINHAGIEGGTVYALSKQLRDAITADGQTSLTIDLRNGLTQDELTARLSVGRGSQSFPTYLRKAAGLQALTAGLLREHKTTAELNTLPPAALAALIKHFPLMLTAPFGLERSISSAGGLRFEELDADCQIKKLPGVYAIGEMLDWEAPTGGYLLQASYSMAVAAATAILKAQG